MFGKGKLLREGAEAQGVVIESLGHDLAQGGISRAYKVKVRVQFDDGATAEVSGKLDRYEDGWYTEGAILPVRYDATDRSKIEIDEPALKAREKAKLAQASGRDQDAIAQAERRLAQGGAAGAAPSSGQAMNLGTQDPELAELLSYEDDRTGAIPALDGSQTRLDRLAQLADLHDRGVLSDEELAAEKAKILNES